MQRLVLYLNMFTWAILGALPTSADDALIRQGYSSIDELFKTYQRASESRDWKALFSLGTPAYQDQQLLELAVSAAISNDPALRTIADNYGLDWKQFDHPWTEEENQRFTKDSPMLAKQIGEQVSKRAELYVAAHTCIQKASLPSTTKVKELRNLVQQGNNATADSIEINTVTESRLDAQGKVIGRALRDISISSKLIFRKIDGKWYLAMQREMIELDKP